MRRPFLLAAISGLSLVLVLSTGAAQASDWVVTSTTDTPDPGTLRSALETPRTDEEIAASDAARTVTFSLSGGATKIELNSDINVAAGITQVSINGSLGGGQKVTIASSAPSTVSDGAIVSAGTSVTISSGADVSVSNAVLDTVRVDATGAVAITDSTITGNVSASNGGAVHSGADVTVASSSFIANQSLGYGGAIAANTVNLSGTNTFSGNTAASTGGAINSDHEVSITGNVIATSNTAASAGGAINVVNGSDITITGDATFTSNTSANSGGAVQTQGGLSVSGNLTATNNVALGEGGVIIAGTHGVVIGGNLVASGNTATFGNGGVISTTGVLQVTGSAQFTSNTSGTDGGAVLAHDVSVGGTLTAAQNMAAGQGGAIRVNNSDGSGNSLTVAGRVALTSNRAGQVSGGVDGFQASGAGGSGGAISATGNVNLNTSGVGANSITGNSSESVLSRTFVALGSYTAGGFANYHLSVDSYSVGNVGGGGAIFSESSVAIHGVTTLTSNSAFNGSGGAINTGGNLSISHSALTASVIANNSVSFEDLTSRTCTLEVTESLWGGSEHAYTSVDVRDMNNDIGGCSSSSTSDGGALYAGGNINLSATTITSNTAMGNGGALYAGGNITVGSNSAVSVITQNAALRQPVTCVVIVQLNGNSVRSVDCTNSGAAGAMFATGSLDVTNPYFSANSAESTTAPLTQIYSATIYAAQNFPVVTSTSGDHSVASEIINYDALYSYTITSDKGLLVVDGADPSAFRISALSASDTATITIVRTLIADPTDVETVTWSATSSPAPAPTDEETSGGSGGSHSSPASEADADAIVTRQEYRAQQRQISVGRENLTKILESVLSPEKPIEAPKLIESIKSDEKIATLTKDGWLEKLNKDNPLVLFAAAADTSDGAIGQLLISSMAKDFDAAAFAQFKELISGGNNVDFLAIFEKTFGVSFEEWLKSNAIPDLLKALTSAK